MAGTLQAFMSACTATMNSITSRVGALEAVAPNAYESRVSALETASGAQNARITSIEAWRAAKAPASADVPTNFAVQTDVITLGLTAPRASSINAIINTIMGEVNGIKAILRAREIMAT